MNMKTFYQQLQASKQASFGIGRLSAGQRADLLKSIGDAVMHHKMDILSANKRDLTGRSSDHTTKDRLVLNDASMHHMRQTAYVVAELSDILDTVLEDRTIIVASGEVTALQLQKITVPFGVVAMIYESRPNVTLDAILLALKAGNSIVLRGGSEAYESNKAIVKAAQSVLAQYGLDEAVIYLMSPDRRLVKQLLTAHRMVDLLIPRGSASLIQFVREHATVPVIETGAGVCHAYIASTAQLQKASEIVCNGKLQRQSVCNALDTIILDEQVAKQFLETIAPAFSECNVDIFADELAYEVMKKLNYQYLNKATKQHYGTEYLGHSCSIKTVKNIDEALMHITEYSSGHTEVIVSDDTALCERFIREVDAAVVVANASSRFTDGEMFGLGAEMGISTQKLHARGPFAYEKLVTEKYVIRGDGHVRK